MRSILGACSALLALLFTAHVQAAELVRVQLFADARQITLGAERGVLAGVSSRVERMFRRPVLVQVGASGMVINGTRVRTGMVRFRSRDKWLTVTAPATLGDLSKRPPPTSARMPNTFTVTGTVQVLRRGTGLMVINLLDVEDYVKGVVPAEMNTAWHLEALKAQAVAARTYAIHQRLQSAERDYDVVAGIQDQVYRGRLGLDQRVEQAVESTRELVITYQNQPILAAFSSTAAGPTEDAMNVWSKDLPYLKGVDCPFDTNSPYYEWRVEVPVQALEQSLRAEGLEVGTIATVTPYTYSRAGRVDKLRILHSAGELILRGQDLRRLVGYSTIPSTQFEIERMGREIVLAGRGSGHAVGLCQWGAKELAERGYPFSTILRYYFPGTDLKPLRQVRRSPSSS